ncbi:MAG: cupredoxin domain-containing protein [Actinomycetota bacterium]|nr:cupredoxin domain-containing protein [Actinomycetota bacterium]
MKRAVALIALTLAVLATGACNEGTDDSAPTEANNGGAAPQRVTVTATDFDFDQAGITLEPGVIEVTLVNDGDVQHSFTSRGTGGLGFDLLANPGEEASTTFTLPSGDTYPFQCRFHPDEMRGAIYVDRTSDT